MNQKFLFFFFIFSYLSEEVGEVLVQQYLLKGALEGGLML